MKITCTRVLEFDAAHRVMGHESKCATLHGHRYKLEVTAEAPLDSIGRVVDFSVLKSVLGRWIDENWDHTTIVFFKDTQTHGALLAMPSNKKPFVSDWNPTAENIASFVLRVLGPEHMEPFGVKLVKVVCWETPNCFATAEL